MNHPQTLAVEMAKNFPELKNIKVIAESACAAFTFIWCLGIECSDIEAIRIVSDALDAKVIESDCTVTWYKFGKWLTGRDIDVVHVPIKDILDIRERTPVFYKYKGKPHCVGVEKGKVKFNSVEKSEILERGLPVEKRVIKIMGIKK